MSHKFQKLRENQSKNNVDFITDNKKNSQTKQISILIMNQIHMSSSNYPSTKFNQTINTKTFTRTYMANILQIN